MFLNFNLKNLRLRSADEKSTNRKFKQSVGSRNKLNLLPFDIDKVKLNDKYFAIRRELVKKYIIEFDVNRLMHTFRINAGIPSDAEALGGWEDVDCDLRGHTVGHFLSSCSKFAFADKDEFLKRKANNIVDILETCAKPNGYLSAFGEEKLDTLEFLENRDVWAPYYTLHKILQGLVDCYTFIDNRKALSLALSLAYYIHGRFKKLSFWKIDGILRCTKVNPVNEFGGMGDVFYSLYEITGDAQILETAEIFDRDYFIDKLAEGLDILENLHANTHLPMVIAAMHRFNISGEEKYKTAAVNFYSYLSGRTFANGNNSSKAKAFIKGGVSEKSEHWGGFGSLGDALTGGESESCCAHNTERILEKLFEWFGSVEFLDHMEILKYNAVLNSASNQTGLSQYHQPMGVGAVKKFSSPYDTFWCCTASGIEAMSEVQKNIWFKNKDSILLNMFISSAAYWDEMNVSVTQLTEYPDVLTSTLIVNTKLPVEFKLILKESSIKAVKVNSKSIDLKRENGYVIIHRIFKDKDTVEIEISALLHLVPLKGCEEKVAVMYGRVLLAEIGKGTLLENQKRPNWGDITDENVNRKLTKVKGNQLSFVLGGNEEKRIEFIPLFRVEDEVYTVYMSLKNDFSQIKKFTFAQDGSSEYK